MQFSPLAWDEFSLGANDLTLSQQISQQTANFKGIWGSLDDYAFIFILGPLLHWERI